MEKQLKPKLRFPEFYGEWEICKLSKFIKNLLSGVSVNSIDREINQNEFGILKTSSVVNGKFISTENKLIVIEEIERAKLNPKKHNLLISRMNTPDLVGNFGYIEKNYPNLFIPDRLWMTDLNNNIHPKYLNYSLLTPKSKNKITSLATGTSNSMKNISKSSFLDIEIYTASIPEQQKIADYLTTIDRKIELLEEKKTELSRYKKAMMQKLFSQEIRFIDDNGNDFADWEEKRLGEVASFVVTKNKSNLSLPILTNSAEFGVINQEDFFDNQIANDKSLDTYIVLDEYEFVYNPRISKHAPYGPININKLTKGLLSPLYSVFKINDVIMNYDFVDYYFKTSKWHKYMAISGNQGARSDRMAVNKNTLSNIPISKPSLPEQQKIADFLSAIDESLDKVTEQLEETRIFKKAMLQQMFV